MTVVINYPAAGGGGGGGGGGSSTFAALTDASTANIPSINTPTGTALSLKTAAEGIWNLTTNVATEPDGVTTFTPANGVYVANGNFLLCTGTGTRTLDGNTYNVGDYAVMNPALGQWVRINSSAGSIANTTSVLVGNNLGSAVAGVAGTDFFAAPVFKTGVPIGVMPNCTIGASGVITFGTTTPTAYPQGVWMWYSVAALYSGSLAGWYWTVLTGTQGSAASGGTVYNNYLASTGSAAQQAGTSSGGVLAPNFPIPASPTTTGITGGTHTQPTATNLYVPGPSFAANYFGNNGGAELRMLIRSNNSANIKAMQVVPFWAVSNVTTQTLTPVIATWINQGVPGHQTEAFVDFTAGSANYPAVDTTATQVANPRFNFAAGGSGNDWQVLEYVIITPTPRS